MDLIEQIQAALDPVAQGGAWYGVNTAEPVAYPYITWQQIASPTNNSLAGASDLQNTRIQVDIISLQVSSLPQLTSSLLSALQASGIDHIQLSAQDFPEPAIRAYRRSIDFSVWSTLQA